MDRIARIASHIDPLKVCWVRPLIFLQALHPCIALIPPSIPYRHMYYSDIIRVHRLRYHISYLIQEQEPTSTHLHPIHTAASFATDKFNVAVLGAAGGIGQPLSLLLKLYDLRICIYSLILTTPLFNKK